MKNFSIERRIYYHNTDAGGVVYYATYLHFLEEGRVEFLRGLGIDTSVYLAKDICFPVVHVEVDYKAPAKYGDLIEIFTRIEKIGNASIHFIQEIKKDSALLVKAKTVWVCTGLDFKVKPIPDEIKTILA